MNHPELTRRWADLAHRSNRVVSLLETTLTQTGQEWVTTEARHLIDYNEYGVAIEGLLDSLHEYDCPVPRPAYELLTARCVDMGLGLARCSDIASQVVE
jgi:hypothetical protein